MNVPDYSSTIANVWAQGARVPKVGLAEIYNAQAMRESAEANREYRQQQMELRRQKQIGDLRQQDQQAMKNIAAEGAKLWDDTLAGWAESGQPIDIGKRQEAYAKFTEMLHRGVERASPGISQRHGLTPADFSEPMLYALAKRGGYSGKYTPTAGVNDISEAGMGVLAGADRPETLGTPIINNRGEVFMPDRAGGVTQLDIGGQKFQPPVKVDQGSGTVLVDQYTRKPLAVYPNAQSPENKATTGFDVGTGAVPPPVMHGGPPPAGANLPPPVFNFAPGTSPEVKLRAYEDYYQNGKTPATGPAFQPTPQPTTSPAPGGGPVAPAGRAQGIPGYAEEEARRAAMTEKAKSDIQTGAKLDQARNENLVKQEGQIQDKGRRAQDILGLIGAPLSKQAAQLDDTIRKATGSGAGAAVDSVAAFFGQTTPGAENIGSLEALGSQLLYNVPRFEGPQSNIDVQTYREAAGDIANPSTPTLKKLSRIAELRSIMQGYADGTRGRILDVQEQASQPAQAPQNPSFQNVEQPAQAPPTPPRPPAPGMVWLRGKKTGQWREVPAQQVGQ